MRRVFLMAAAAAALLAIAGSASAQAKPRPCTPDDCTPGPEPMPIPPAAAAKTALAPLLVSMSPARVLKAAENPMPVPWPPGLRSGPGPVPQQPPARVSI